MFLEFGAGMLIAVLYRKIKIISVFFPIVLGLIAVAIYIYLLFNGHGEVGEAYLINKGVYTWHRLFVFGIPTILLFICLLFWEKKTSSYFLKSDNIALIGDASYSIYLVHSILYFILFHALKEQLALIYPDLLIILLLIFSTTLGIIYHKVVENRLISIFSSLLLKKKQKK
jgi:peptidoglycan/LPS O-acetylase OafA/YrhL